MKPTLSFIVPAYNEEQHLHITIEELVKVLRTEVSEYEIIIVDDGSTDNTGEVADNLARTDPYIKVVHHPRNKGFGFACRAGLEQASKEFVSWAPSDTTWDPDRLKKNIALLGQTDIIVTYLSAFYKKEFHRRVISRFFTHAVNLLSGLRLKYYNGCSFFRTSLIKSIPNQSEGFTFWAEALVRLITSGASYCQVGANFEERIFGKTKVFKPKNIRDTLKFLFVVVRDIPKKISYNR